MAYLREGKMNFQVTSMIWAVAATLFSGATGQVSLLQARVETDRAPQSLSPARREHHMSWHINKPAVVVQSNLGGFGPSSGVQELRIENVSVLHSWAEGHPANESSGNYSSGEDIPLDLLIVAESDYRNNDKVGQNGASDEFGVIYVKTKTTETFRFSFVKMGTYEEFVIAEFDFTIFDIDQPGPNNYCAEMVTGWLVERYATLSNAYHDILEDVGDDRVQVCSNVTINNGEVTNPTQVRTLSNAQARASVMFSYRNTSSFRITMTNSAGGPRALIFAGTSDALEPPTGEWHEHFLPLNDTYLNGYSREFYWYLHRPANVTANNLGHRGPNFDDEPEIRFRSVGYLNTVDESTNTTETMMLDLVIFTEDPYWASDHVISEWNGAQGEFGEVGLSRQSNVTLIYTFVETDTHKPKVVPLFDWTLFDIDNQEDPNLGEEYTVHGAYSYSIKDGAFTIIDNSVPNQVHLKSNVTIFGEFQGAIENPDSLDTLSVNQYKACVQFQFKETSHWEVDFITTAHRERALVFGPHPDPPIDAPNSTDHTTVLVPTLSPTLAPTAPPTMPTSTVFGDPHIQNMQGRKFDIDLAGSYKFLAIPRTAPQGTALLEILGRVTPRGDPCAGQLYLTGLSIAGEWLGNMSRLELSTRGEGFNTNESVGLRMGDAEKDLSVEDFAGSFPPRMATVTRFYPEEPQDLNKHVTTLLVRLYLGPTILKITWEHQKEKIGFSNSLMLLTYGLGAVDGEVGGLLGTDDQSDATEALDADGCEALRGRVPNQIGHAWAIAHLEKEESDAA